MREHDRRPPARVGPGQKVEAAQTARHIESGAPLAKEGLSGALTPILRSTVHDRGLQGPSDRHLCLDG